VSDHDDEAPTIVRLPLIPPPGEIADTLERRRRIEDELAGQVREALRSVEEAAAAVGTAGDVLDQAVRHARAAGASWSDIARGCGFSRQAAQQRWSDS
jgi:hypothetical protein